MTSLPLAACSLHSSEQVYIELRCELGDAVENYILLPATGCSLVLGQWWCMDEYPWSARKPSMWQPELPRLAATWMRATDCQSVCWCSGSWRVSASSNMLLESKWPASSPDLNLSQSDTPFVHLLPLSCNKSCLATDLVAIWHVTRYILQHFHLYLRHSSVPTSFLSFMWQIKTRLERDISINVFRLGDSWCMITFSGNLLVSLFKMCFTFTCSLSPSFIYFIHTDWG